jgi:predicted CxxxxCH...CXXCH cytochrome family protein
MKTSIICLAFVLLARIAFAATVVDAPHNESNNMGCTGCHNYSLWWEFSPVQSDPDLRSVKVNTICLNCHGDNGPEITAVTHAALAMAILSRAAREGGIGLGEWARICTDCHDPHFQAQLDWRGTVTDAELFLVTGDLTPATIATDGDGTPASPYTTTFHFTNAAAKSKWQNATSPWAAKSGTIGRGLILVLSTATPDVTFELTGVAFDPPEVDETAGTITVQGKIPASYDSGVHFGLIYGQLIKKEIDGPAGKHNVKFFDPNGGYVDPVNHEGLCQVCHSLTTHFQYNATDVTGDHADKTDNSFATGAASRCTDCHKHGRGFGPGSDSGKHPDHLAMGFACTDCHLPGGGVMDPLTAGGCNTCHQDGKNGPPNDGGDYRNHWFDLDPGYTLTCSSCHKGRLLLADATNTINYTHLPGDSECDNCHDGRTTLADVVNTTYTHQPADNNCASCHDGPGANPLTDFRKAPVGMQSNGHTRLASSKWIRQYACYYCHTDTVDAAGTWKAAHLNSAIDVKIDSQWAIVGMPVPQYIAASQTCRNVYCHSDGTTLNPEMRDYAWTGGHQECNSCHGHNPSSGGCNASGCHSDGRDGTYWDKFPEKKWLSAMPMYQNSGPLTDKANSHYRHLFTGFSCDDCHAGTISGGGCLQCHNTTIPMGNMTENQHINPAKHVNRVKNVIFKNGGTYDADTKTCSNTACHTGANPQWGGSVHDAVVCRDCHGATTADVDDFGKFNNTRAKINLTQWATSGHGRPGVIDPATGKPQLTTNRYPSGNPPANFPDNGCWYCHDSQVLHQNEERPFRLIQHEHFKNRFEKECVFCHMQGQDSECLTCHNATESLAPQLAAIAPLPDVINPPYTIARPDHSGFSGGCSASTCHVDDAARHKTDAGVWSDEKKEDVKNAYVQMGVCLICHDDDKGGECAACHTGPQYALGFDPASNDPGLVGKTAGRIVPQKAKASSFHFGYKHYQDYQDSLGNQLDAGVVSQASTSTREVMDTSKAWTQDAFVGRRVTILSGANTNLTRPIVRNSATTLTVAPPFPDGQQLQAGDTYAVMDFVWKGGKFCWDCHDPHGDDNIFMIQNMVATRSDGVVGKPVDRKEVSFTRKSTGLDYARIAPNPATGKYDGVCNVCHTNTEMHYTASKGDNHNSGRVCTECHEHRFTDSHASGQTCNTCHPNRPVPRHTGFSQARDCTKCHKDAIGARMNIMKQFSANSHHVQTDKVTNKHCYACHWEATPEGVINLDHHAGYNYKTHTSQKDKEVDLVIWQSDVRPTVFENDGANGDDTAASFLAAKIDTTKPGNTLADQRGEVDKITNHCLGCHSDKNNDTEPFNQVDPAHGDCKTPRQYAWDRASIDSRYSNSGTATLGKYNSVNAAKKMVTKAFSAHGNAVANQGGTDPAIGVDGAIPNTRAGIWNIQCFDCHSSHGSMVTGITSSYTTFNGTKNGANLKETQAGKGGYPMTYLATANPNPNTVNPYQTGAGQCFDCHETASSNTQISPVSKSPWGYSETFGATTPIKGYRDNPRFSGAYSGASQFSAYRAEKHTLGGHFKASHKNPESPNFDTTGVSDINAMGTIDGLCTPCHDPHGVSPSLGDKKAYALPLLKGTWLSSPYKEDGAPLGTYLNYDDSDDGWSGAYPGNPPPYPQRPNPQPSGVWRTDRNTFNPGDLSVQANNSASGYARVSEDAATFAGLCLRCHPKETLTTETSATPTSATPWASVERIHRSVQGWGWNNGETPREHSYTCSKCHQPHASGLPRLMQTNCLNGDHRGQVTAGGSPGGGDNGAFPVGFTYPNSGNCHGAPTANGAAGWPNNQRWNLVTPWTGGQP